jgi:hypothetical protein
MGVKRCLREEGSNGIAEGVDLSNFLEPITQL